MIGSRGTGMGGAGVAQIDDENAPQWNPANLSLPYGTLYEDDYATSLGVQAGAQVQSTNNFLQNSQDLVDFFEQNENSEIFDGDYSDESRDEFVELLSLTRDLEGDDQGALLNVTGGLNSRHTNWSISANNITDVAAYSSLDLTGGIAFDSAKVPEAFGDTVSSPKSSTYQDVENSCSSTFQEGTWTTGDFGFSNIGNKDQLAGYVADYAESESIDPNTVKKACESGNEILEQSASATGGSTNDQFDTSAQRLVFEGASVSEVSFSYAKPEPLMSLASSPVYLGTNIRLMQADVAYIEENPFNTSASDENDEVFDEEDDLETSTDVGVDLGLAYDAREHLGLTFGLTGKYLNTPTFDYPDNEDTRDTTVVAPDELEIEPQLRVGVSGYPLDFMPVDMGSDWWQVSVDYDITKNETLLQDYEKQYLAVGNEFNFINSFWGNLSLRVGARENLAESKEGALFTGGVGLRLAGLNVEVSGVMSDKTTKNEDGDEMPTVAGGSFNLAYRF